MLAQLCDGHTWIDGNSFGSASDTVPIQFGTFDDGLFVVAAAAPHQELIGNRVLRIGSLTWDELKARARAVFAMIQPGRGRRSVTVRLIGSQAGTRSD